MKRHRLLIYAVLLLMWVAGGAIVNVAVAWGLVAYDVETGLTCIDIDRGKSVTWRAGAPFRSMSGVWRGHPNTTVGFWVVKMRFNHGNKSEVTRFPFIPIWPGFAINTIFYAAILWVMFALPGKARRYLRGKRGLCTACGYDLQGLTARPPTAPTICPECGSAVSQKK